MTASFKELMPILDNMASFVADALTSQKTAQDRMAQLEEENRLLKSEKITLEKVASTAVVLDGEKLRFMLTKLASMGIMDRGCSDDLEVRFQEDPNALLPFVIKLAETLQVVGSDQGRGVPSEMMAESADPDGWGDLLAGRPVLIRRP